MPIIRYKAKGFSSHWGRLLAGSNHLSASWNDLVWAAMTVGKPSIAFLLAHGWHSLSDLIVRSHTLYANLRQAHGFLNRSDLYESLDPTEKSGVSYFMGMAAAKLLAARLLDVPWLFHLSMIKAMGGTIVLKGKSQPDLIGLRRNRDWIVAEAKGRTSGYSPHAMRTGKLQVRQLRQINGAYPALRIVVQTFFAPYLQLALEDPEEYDEDAQDMSFEIERTLRAYYSPFMAAIAQESQMRTIADREFVSRTIEEAGVTLAIERMVSERLAAGTIADAGDVSLEHKTEAFPMVEGFVFYPDGIAISLDERWSEPRMRREPGARREG